MDVMVSMGNRVPNLNSQGDAYRHGIMRPLMQCPIIKTTTVPKPSAVSAKSETRTEENINTRNGNLGVFRWIWLQYAQHAGREFLDVFNRMETQDAS